MATPDDAMHERRESGGGAGMEPTRSAEMDREKPDLHTLDPEAQRESMGLAEPGAAMGQPPQEGAASEEEVARREEAAKRGESP